MVTRQVLVCAGLLVAMGFGMTSGATEALSAEPGSEVQDGVQSEAEDPNWGYEVSPYRYLNFKKVEVCGQQGNAQSIPIIEASESSVDYILFAVHRCEDLEQKSSWKFFAPSMGKVFLTRLPEMPVFDNLTVYESLNLIFRNDDSWRGYRFSEPASIGSYQSFFLDDSGGLVLILLEVISETDNELQVRYKVFSTPKPAEEENAEN